jgi:hypothetical protein
MDSMSIKYPKSLVENVTSVFIAERTSQNTWNDLKNDIFMICKRNTFINIVNYIIILGHNFFCWLVKKIFKNLFENLIWLCHVLLIDQLIILK